MHAASFPRTLVKWSLIASLAIACADAAVPDKTLRVAVAAAETSFDPAFANDDISTVVIDSILEALAALHRSGLALLLVEQNVQAALSLAGRGYVLERGRVVREGAGAALLGDPEIRRAYLGPLA